MGVAKTCRVSETKTVATLRPAMPSCRPKNLLGPGNVALRETPSQENTVTLALRGRFAQSNPSKNGMGLLWQGHRFS